MKIVNWITCLGLMGLLLGCNRNSGSSGGSAEDQSTAAGSGQGGSASVDADNTGRNTRDRSDSALTPGDQGGSEADRETTRRIRRAITSNDQLSTEAKNIKIVTINGKVTLRGPVKSQQELNTIQSIVQQAGVGSFDNQLEVEANNQ